MKLNIIEKLRVGQFFVNNTQTIGWHTICLLNYISGFVIIILSFMSIIGGLSHCIVYYQQLIGRSVKSNLSRSEHIKACV